MHLQNLMQSLLNFKEKISHQITPLEIALIKDTHLFNNLSENSFSKLLGSIEILHLLDETQVFQYEAHRDALYIVSQGLIRLFIYDRQGKKVIINSLTKGKYFGAETVIGKFNPGHKIYIEALGETKLIKISAKFMLLALKADSEVRKSLVKAAYKQSISTTVAALGFYSEMQTLLEKAEEHGYIFELTDKEILFKFGDPPDYAYFIIDGEVELQFSNHQNNITLHEGYLFGELSIIHNKTRAATAVMRGTTHLLAIPAKIFKQYFTQSSSLQHIIEKLQQTYQLPSKKTVEQFVGNIPNMGTTITSLSKTIEGKYVLSEMSLDQELFIFTVSNVVGEKNYRYQLNNENIRELSVLNGYIVGIKVHGAWDSLADICQLALENVKIPECTLNDFQLTGEIKL